MSDLKDFNGALQYLDKAIAKKSDHAKSLALRGDLRIRRKDYDGALADLGAAIAADPEDAEALSSRARVHLAKGNFGKAIEDLNASLQLDPDQAAPYHDRGTIALRKQASARGAALAPCASAKRPSSRSVRSPCSQSSVLPARRGCRPSSKTRCPSGTQRPWPPLTLTGSTAPPTFVSFVMIEPPGWNSLIRIRPR